MEFRSQPHKKDTLKPLVLPDQNIKPRYPHKALLEPLHLSLCKNENIQVDMTNLRDLPRLSISTVDTFGSFFEQEVNEQQMLSSTRSEKDSLRGIDLENDNDIKKKEKQASMVQTKKEELQLKEENPVAGFLDLVNRASSFWVKTFTKKSEILNDKKIVSSIKDEELSTHVPAVTTITPLDSLLHAIPSKKTFDIQDSLDSEEIMSDKESDYGFLFKDKTKGPLSLRFENLQQNEIKRCSKWTNRHDELLLKLAKEMKNDWKRIARQFPNTLVSPKFIRDRYKALTTTLLPKKTRFVHEEDLKIAKYYKKYGSNWKIIANLLPGRTPTMIKNRFYSFIRKKGMVPSLLSELDQRPSPITYANETPSQGSQQEPQYSNTYDDNGSGTLTEGVQINEVPPIGDNWDLDYEKFLTFKNHNDDHLRDKINSPLKDDWLNNGGQGNYYDFYQNFNDYHAEQPAHQTRDFDDQLSIFDFGKEQRHEASGDFMGNSEGLKHLQLFTHEEELDFFNHLHHNDHTTGAETLGEEIAAYFREENPETIMKETEKKTEPEGAKGDQKEILSSLDYKLSSLALLCSQMQTELQRERERLLKKNP